MRGIASMMKASKRKQKKSKQAIMIIIDEEDQSSLMLSMMLASMLSNLLLSRLRTLSTCDLAVSPAHLVLSLACDCLNCSAWRGVAFQMKRFELSVDRVSP